MFTCSQIPQLGYVATLGKQKEATYLSSSRSRQRAQEVYTRGQVPTPDRLSSYDLDLARGRWVSP